LSFMYDQHDFLEKLPVIGKVLREALPNDVVAVSGGIHHNIFDNKWGKNIEFRRSGTTAKPQLKTDPERLNQEGVKQMLTNIAHATPSTAGVAEQAGIVGTRLGGMLVAREALTDDE